MNNINLFIFFSIWDFFELLLLIGEKIESSFWQMRVIEQNVSKFGPYILLSFDSLYATTRYVKNIEKRQEMTWENVLDHLQTISC